MAEWFTVNVDKMIGDLDKKVDVIFAENIKEASKQLLWRVNDKFVNSEEVNNLLNNILEEKSYSYFKFNYEGEEVKAFIEHTKSPVDFIKKNS